MFVMLIGIPGSGKSTYADKSDGVVLSSDEIRERFSDWSNEKVFSHMRSQTKENLEKGRTVIYDATNTVRKRRRDILNMVRKMGVPTKAVVFATPIEECVKRNAARERVVPEYIVRRMALHFEFPYPNEFDSIEIVQNSISEDVFKMDWDMPQDNPNHTLSLKEHMDKTGRNLWNTLGIAGRVHDIGKLYTKEFKDSHGRPTKEAHYYSHEKLGAYIWMTSNWMDETNIRVTQLINYHMRPFVWEVSERAKNLDCEEFGEEFIKELKELHDADVSAK